MKITPLPELFRAELVKLGEGVFLVYDHDNNKILFVSQRRNKNLIIYEIDQPGDPKGTSASLLAAHVAAADPHTGYRLESIALTDADVAAANKDGTIATPSLRTLGVGAQQAAAGNHSHGTFTPTYQLITFVGDTVVNIPAGAVRCKVRLIGSGGGGGSGRRGAASTARSGGAGASGAGATEAEFSAAELRSLSAGTNQFTVRGGAVGAGGAARTTDNTDGADGGAGNPALMILNGVTILYAPAGVGGAKGTSAQPPTTQPTTTTARYVGGTGGQPGGGSTAQEGQPGGDTATDGGAGGGGGGGIGSANITRVGGEGGSGGTSFTGSTTGVAGGTTDGQSGSAGGTARTPPTGGNGGGGGSYGLTAAAGAGGTGQSYGGGGGGGGGSLNGFNSGAGGNGGAFCAEVWFY